MKRKILVPVVASVVALSMNTVSNADEVTVDNSTQKTENTNSLIELDEYKEVTYKTATIKEGVGVKIREEGDVKHIAYSGDEFKVIAIQGEWIEVATEEGSGWVPMRFVDVKESQGYTTANKVNLRKEANIESEVVEELEIASSFKVLEDNGDWLKIKRGEEEGYISSSYVSDEKPVIEVEEENVETSQSTNNTAPNNGQSSNNASNSNSSSSSSNNETQKPSQDNNQSYNPPAGDASTAQAVVNLAHAQIGKPYVWGAEGPNSFDCSGLTYYVYKNAAGVTLPRSSSAQAGYGKTVSKSSLQPGDLVFFTTNGTGNVSHVGIYIGGGNMIHSPKPGQNVHITSINSSYYSSKFVTAKRVF